jgi:hypothetical protein
MVKAIGLLHKMKPTGQAGRRGGDEMVEGPLAGQDARECIAAHSAPLAAPLTHPESGAA